MTQDPYLPPASSHRNRTRELAGEEKPLPARYRRLGLEVLEDRRMLSVSFTGSYSQDFDSLPNSGTLVAWRNDATLAGWYLFRQPSPGTGIAAIKTGDGSSASGAFYSFGEEGGATATDRALGAIGVDSSYYGWPGEPAVAGWFALALTNASGMTVDSLSIRYDGEQWRDGGNTYAQTMPLEYGFGGSFDTVSSWIPAGASFNFTSPVHSGWSYSLDGNHSDFRTSGIGGDLINLGWTDGTTLWIRWAENNDDYEDHGLAIDNVRITAEPQIVYDLTELNAADWEVWAQDSTATASDDAVRAIHGTASVKFVTNGGFDNYLRYSSIVNAQWDLREFDHLNLSVYAENSNIGFQEGSPWIRLYDSDGNYFQFQYYQGGNSYDLLNDARDTWQTYQIPLAANDTVDNGWRRTTHGSVDFSRISVLEIHADTWDAGFTLWVDGVSIERNPLLPGDFDRNGIVGSTDYDMWKSTFGQSVAVWSSADANGNGVVDAADFTTWRDHLGTANAVPSQHLGSQNEGFGPVTTTETERADTTDAKRATQQLRNIEKPFDAPARLDLSSNMIAAVLAPVSKASRTPPQRSNVGCQFAEEPNLDIVRRVSRFDAVVCEVPPCTYMGFHNRYSLLSNTVARHQRRQEVIDIAFAELHRQDDDADGLSDLEREKAKHPESHAALIAVLDE